MMATWSMVRAFWLAIALGASALPANAEQRPTDPQPTERDLAYAPSGPKTGQGHLLDLYRPRGIKGAVPVVIFTRGSAWMADNGRTDAERLAAVLNPAGYAVAGVAIRSSAQAQFPAQLQDIKAAVRWLRRNADRYGLDGDRIGILGESSGGWTAAIAAVTGDNPKTDGVGGEKVSSAVQAAVAFYPPTDFLAMDGWATAKCDAGEAARGPGFCHDASDAPEGLLLGCAPSSCPDKVSAASPMRYITKADPPIMVVHGGNDPLVAHAQGEALYQALNKACHDAVFISLPLAGHGEWDRMMTDPELAYGATIRSTSPQGCRSEPQKPYKPSWRTVIDFFDRTLAPPTQARR